MILIAGAEDDGTKSRGNKPSWLCFVIFYFWNESIIQGCVLEKNKLYTGQRNSAGRSFCLPVARKAVTPPPISLTPPPSSGQLSHFCLPLPLCSTLLPHCLACVFFHACIWKNISLHAGVGTCDCLPTPTPRVDAPPRAEPWRPHHLMFP